MGKDRNKNFRAHFRPITFNDYIRPRGYLDTNPACHGLMYYALIAKNAYETVQSEPTLVGDTDPHADLRQLFKSVAFLYGCEPEAMATYWPSVRMQFIQLSLTPPNDQIVKATDKIMRTSNRESSGIGFVSLKKLEEQGKLTPDLKQFGIDFNEFLKKGKS